MKVKWLNVNHSVISYSNFISSLYRIVDAIAHRILAKTAKRTDIAWNVEVAPLSPPPVVVSLPLVVVLLVDSARQEE